jgi:hypothetical protein
MRLTSLRRPSFLLGFATAVGSILALTVVAYAGSGSDGSDRPEQPRPAKESFAAFERARTGGDALSRDAAALLTPLSEEAPRSALDPGRIVATESRRVDGPSGEVTYLVPTDKGQVCFAAPSSGEVGCTDGTALVTDGIDLRLVDTDGLGHGEPSVLRGFVADEVGSVSVATADGNTRVASIANGIFLAVVPAVPEAVVVSFRDGTEQQLSIPPPPKG